MDLDPHTITLADITVPRTRIPEELHVGRELGKGANNKVCACEWEGERCVMRVPRRRSDTQQRGSAVWELRYTLRASQLRVGPTVRRVWYARHASRDWPSGLYMIMDRYDDDLETVLCEDHSAQQGAREHHALLERAICSCLERLAAERMFVFDLKPSNMVLRISDAGEVDVRIIDYGRDFCEWAGCLTDPSRATPHLDFLTRTLDANGDADYGVDAGADDGADDMRAAVVTHILFATMMMLLASTTTFALYDTRDRHRMDAETRKRINPVCHAAGRLLDSMQGRHVQLVRKLLRMDEVRGVLRHYHGRRNAGTHRTFEYARGHEVVA